MFNVPLTDEDIREIGYEDGRTDGRAEGMTIGMEKGMTIGMEKVFALLKQGVSIQDEVRLAGDRGGRPYDSAGARTCLSRRSHLSRQSSARKKINLCY
jgi:hypothetical protein